MCILISKVPPAQVLSSSSRAEEEDKVVGRENNLYNNKCYRTDIITHGQRDGLVEILFQILDFILF